MKVQTDVKGGLLCLNLEVEIEFDLKLFGGCCYRKPSCYSKC